MEIKRWHQCRLPSKDSSLVQKIKVLPIHQEEMLLVQWHVMVSFMECCKVNWSFCKIG